MLPDDVELARTLRKTAKPVTLAVNKIDVPAHAPRVGEFHGLGFERTRGISAEHGRGAWDALEELVALLAAGGGERGRGSARASASPWSDARTSARARS